MTGPSHVYFVYIRATAERVWEAITDPAVTSRYFHETYVKSDWKPQSPWRSDYADGRQVVDGTVLESDPPRRLVYTWRFMEAPRLAAERPSRVTWEIEPLGGVCKLTLTHDDFDEGSLTYAGISMGWPKLLNSMKSLLETGEPLDFPVLAAPSAPGL